MSGGGGVIYEAKIDDGKLFYENRWFHKGQHIFIESKEHGQERFAWEREGGGDNIVQGK